jgi:hypothetical protein
MYHILLALYIQSFFVVYLGNLNIKFRTMFAKNKEQEEEQP